MATKKQNRIEAFIDWENIRNRLNDNYIERLTINQVMDAIEKVANEIGQLRQAVFYGDFTLRRDDAIEIGRKAHFSFRNALRGRSRKDQTDPILVSDLTEAIFTTRDYDSILLCAGDAHYCEPIRKASIKGLTIYICAVGLDVSPDLTCLAPFYPIEKYIGVTLSRKTEEETAFTGLSPKDISRWAKFVSILDSLESNLPFVAVSYFHKDIMLSYSLGGQTQDARTAHIESALASEIIKIEEMDNPVRPGYKMRAIKLNRANALVKEILSRK